MKNIYRFLGTLILLNTLFINFAQESGFTIYTTENSLIPSNNIYHVAIDESQNVWIHSDSGLTKFDRTNWFTYNSQNSQLPSNNILDIKTQAGNIVWVCTDNGLVRIENEIWTVYTHSNSGLRNNSVSDIGFDSQGNIWISNNGAGLLRTDLLSNWELFDISVNSVTLNDIKKFYIDKTDSLWVRHTWATNTGYQFFGWFKVDGDGNASLVFPSDQIWAGNMGYRIGIDSKNAKWIGKEASLDNWWIVKYSDGNFLNTFLMTIERYNGVVVDKYDLIWGYGVLVTLNGDGVCRQYDSENPWRETYSIPFSGTLPYIFQDIAIDSNNVKWIATNVGLAAFNDEPVFSNIWPDGGEVLDVGENYTLQYHSKYSHESKVELTTDNGDTWHLLSVLPNTDSDIYQTTYYDSTIFEWTIPDTIKSSNKCRIRISDLIRGDVYLESNANFTITGTTGITDKTIKFSYSLSNNYPNPFNPTTIIKYEIAALTPVSLKVFDVLGNEVQTLVNEIKSPGIYEVQFDRKQLASGIYFYKLQAGSFFETKKMILLK